MIDDEKEQKKIGDKDDGIKSEDNVKHSFNLFCLGLTHFPSNLLFAEITKK